MSYRLPNIDSQEELYNRAKNMYRITKHSMTMAITHVNFLHTYYYTDLVFLKNKNDTHYRKNEKTQIQELYKDMEGKLKFDTIVV